MIISWPSRFSGRLPYSDVPEKGFIISLSAFSKFLLKNLFSPSLRCNLLGIYSFLFFSFIQNLFGVLVLLFCLFVCFKGILTVSSNFMKSAFKKYGGVWVCLCFSPFLQAVWVAHFLTWNIVRDCLNSFIYQNIYYFKQTWLYLCCMTSSLLLTQIPVSTETSYKFLICCSGYTHISNQEFWPPMLSADFCFFWHVLIPPGENATPQQDQNTKLKAEQIYNISERCNSVSLPFCSLFHPSVWKRVLCFWGWWNTHTAYNLINDTQCPKRRNPYPHAS